MLVTINGLEIPENLTMRCPKIRFNKQSAHLCNGCEHFNGLGMMSPDLKRTWAERWAIRCNHIIERRTEEK